MSCSINPSINNPKPKPVLDQGIQIYKKLLGEKGKTKVEAVIESYWNSRANRFFSLEEYTSALSGAEKSFSKADSLDILSDVEGQFQNLTSTQSKLSSWGIITPSANDFMGNMQRLFDKGKEGERQKKLVEEFIIKPAAEGHQKTIQYTEDLRKRWGKVKKDYKITNKMLQKKIQGNYTVGDAVRLYNWKIDSKDEAYMDKIQLSLEDYKALMAHIEEDNNLKNFADELSKITGREDGYTAKPKNRKWVNDTIYQDLFHTSVNEARKHFMQTFKTNKEAIFSEKVFGNIDKISQSLSDEIEKSLKRMEFGRNAERNTNSKALNQLISWLNDSVAVVMFFNFRSGFLQLLSIANSMNWTFNNPLKVAAAMANVPQFAKDFITLMNSPYLKARRGGKSFEVAAEDIVQEINRSGNPVAAMYTLIKKHVLQNGYMVSSWGDSIAIAVSGAAYYRNRVNNLLSSKGLSESAFAKFEKDRTALESRLQEEGKSAGEIENAVAQFDADNSELSLVMHQSLDEMVEISETSQQSTRPDKLSSQQAGPAGRLILAFTNTPQQYMRITTKAFNDIINGRGDLKTNVSKIMYYSFATQVLFIGLQQGLWELLGDELDDEEKQKKKEDAINTYFSGLLRATGIYGAMAAMALELLSVYSDEDSETLDYVMGFASISPPIQTKMQRIKAYSTIEKAKGYKPNQFDKDQYFSAGQQQFAHGTSLLTNFPADRIMRKWDNIYEAFTGDIDNVTRFMLLAGWNKYSLGINQYRYTPQEFRELRVSNPELWKKLRADYVKRRRQYILDKRLEKRKKRIEEIKARRRQ